MARPPKPEDQVFAAAVRLRMREADLELMKQAAERAGLSLSSWTRERLLVAAREELGKRRGKKRGGG